ncbi:MAG: hypothetical protein LBG11_00915 [Bifidobacteriaceae bacterium]|nr:hypothetical protein [Bifidobacteriaceae bacterium]
MLAEPGRVKPRPSLRVGDHQIVLGPRLWAAAALAGAIIALGVVADGPGGWVVGFAGVLGAILGALLQISPVPRDWKAHANGAVGRLVNIAHDVENAQVQATQLAGAVHDTVRTRVGLVDVQDRLVTVHRNLFTAVADWEAVSPGAIDEVERSQTVGRQALERLSKGGHR